jgi:hypothetical protein
MNFLIPLIATGGARAAVEALHDIPPFPGLPDDSRLEVERSGFGRYLLCAPDESPD